jgi:hypothetical protein
VPKYEVRVQISGTRNGEDWPNIGGQIDLPEVEAADYLAAGFVIETATVSTAPKVSTRKTETRKG